MNVGNGRLSCPGISQFIALTQVASRDN